jgi:hypothetical protein
MTSYYVLRPEVPGGMGDGTVLHQRPGTYPLVERIEFEWGYGSLGDELITTHPVYLVTKPLAETLRSAGLSGFTLSSDVAMSVDDNVRELEPDWRPPTLEWLHVAGSAGVDDFGLTDDASLVVSDKALAVLRTHQIDNCDVEPY